jgi:hypothetical protein
MRENHELHSEGLRVLILLIGGLGSLAQARCWRRFAAFPGCSGEYMVSVGIIFNGMKRGADSRWMEDRVFLIG